MDIHAQDQYIRVRHGSRHGITRPPRPPLSPISKGRTPILPSVTVFLLFPKLGIVVTATARPAIGTAHAGRANAYWVKIARDGTPASNPLPRYTHHRDQRAETQKELQSTPRLLGCAGYNLKGHQSRLRCWVSGDPRFFFLFLHSFFFSWWPMVRSLRSYPFSHFNSSSTYSPVSQLL